MPQRPLRPGEVVDDSPATRRLLGVSRGFWRKSKYHTPRRDWPDKPNRPWPQEKPKANLFAGAKPKGAAWYRAERELEKRRVLWQDKAKPGHVTDHQWECRRLLEVEGLLKPMSQTEAAEIMGISQKNLRKNAIKAGWAGKTSR